MAEIVLDRVTKSYPDGATAVKDLSITIADGEFIILVGPSGCGKSTTLNMIAGLEDISSGEMRIGGERVNDKAPKDRDIAMVFQSYALYPHMTVRQNIAFPLTLAKLKKADIATKVDETAKILDLTALLDRKPGQLSGGQRQRVAMGRAIVRDPKAFLMDEPLSNLDAKLRVQMRAEIARLQNRLGTTTVYVTHDQTEAMTLGDRVVVLLAGEAQQIGTPEELYARPANLFVAGFIGSPAMNFFPATMTDVGLKLPFGDVTLTQEVHDMLARHNTPTNVIVGIRPEHLEDASLIDTYARIRALTFEVTVDFVESLGADKYVHFTAEGAGAHAAQLAELAAESGVGENEFVARVSTESKVTPGQNDGAGVRYHQAGDLRRRHRGQPHYSDDGSRARRDTDTAGRGATGTAGRADLAAAGVTDVLADVRAHLRAHFAREPDAASVTFLGTQSFDVLRFGPEDDDVIHYASLGCSREPMTDPAEFVADPLRGTRAEVVVALRGPTPTGLARSVAVLAAAPAVEGLVLAPDALVDLGAPLWNGAAFTAFLLDRSEIGDVDLPSPLDPVAVLSAIPITPTEAAWVRLKGAQAMRDAWLADGVDVLDPNRKASAPS